jgi:hypothetical protein
MRQSVRGLQAALGGVALALGLLGGAVAAPSEDEQAALYEVRSDLVEALRDIKVDLARYRSYRDDPSWYVVGEGWGFVDLDRLIDHVPIARHLLDQPGTFEALSAQPFWLDAPLIASVSLLLDESDSSATVGRTASALAGQLSQSREQKAALVREQLQLAREERELTITALDTLDALIEGLGLPLPGPSADDVVIGPGATPGPGTAGVMAAFREQLAADVAASRARIRSCREWIGDPDVYIDDDYVYAGFDLARLPDFERAVELIRDDAGLWAIFNAPAARGSDLDIATRLYLDTFEDVPADLSRITAGVVEANRQASKQKRNEHCVGILGEGKRNRDALVEALATADEISATLGLMREPAPPAPPATPAPTAQPTSPPPPPAPTAQPTPPPTLTPRPTPTPTPAATPPPEASPTAKPESMETPVPDPFADL